MYHRIVVVVLAALFVTGCRFSADTKSDVFTSNAIVTDKTRKCIECHKTKQPSVVDSWQGSSHAAAGIGCYECHKANSGDVDALEHFDDTISVIVSPLDCRQCHESEVEQFLGSHHAKGGQILGSLDNFLGEVVEGYGAAVNGCQACHGTIVTVADSGRLSPDTWPNFGIGRVNPDGSAGSCVACHSRHDFSLSQAREPETCGRCHLGPDHPQMEVYTESKHNIAYRSHFDEMNMDSKTWVVGANYTAAPTCATCHVSATLNQSRTHDIGLRMSWNIRAKISKKTDNHVRKRLAMKDVCLSCHTPRYVNNFYRQFDAGISLYNNKFAIPAQDIIKQLTKSKLIDTIPFNEHIDWTWFYLWHHEGRRARNGIAMMGPDYVQWHGFYDIAERFYMHLVPEAEELFPGITSEILSRPEHRWFKGRMSTSDRQNIKKFYQDSLYSK